MKSTQDISDQCIRILDRLCFKYRDFSIPEMMTSETHYMTDKEKSIHFTVKNKLVSLESLKMAEARQRIIQKRLRKNKI